MKQAINKKPYESIIDSYNKSILKGEKSIKEFQQIIINLQQDLEKLRNS